MNMKMNRRSQLTMTKIFKLLLALVGLAASVTLITTTLAMDEDEITSTFYYQYQNNDNQHAGYDDFDVDDDLDSDDVLVEEDYDYYDDEDEYYDYDEDDDYDEEDEYDENEDFDAIEFDFLSAAVGPILNPYDSFGNPNHVFRAQPQLITGFDHVSVLREDGTVWSWGRNEESQLGNGGRVNQHTPVQARTLRNIQQISSQKIHAMALDADGHVWTWGWGGEGQLGVGNPGCNVLPIQVCAPRVVGQPDCHAYLTNIVQVDAGMLFSVALRSDGTVWAWGRNSRGQMGDSSLIDRTLPVQLPFPAGIEAISAGHEHIMALRNGRVYSLGLNSNGQLGDNTLTNRYMPVVAVGLNNVVRIVAGGFHSYAITADGHLYVWGRNHRGQLGLGVPITGANDRRLIPERNPHVTNIRDIAVGGEHTLVLHHNGTVTTWGRNNHGQLGTGTVGGDGHYQYGMPQTLSLTNVALVSAGESHSVVMFGNGDVHAWGDNWNGQLGRAPEPLYSTTPVQVRAQLRGDNGSLMHSAGTEYLTNVTQISAGSMFTLALREGFNDHPGTVWGWGRNNHGQLVMQSTVDHRSAVRLIDFRSDDPRFGTPSGYNLTNAAQISSGTLFAHGFGLALLDEERGRVLSWGDNIHGQLGDGTFDASRDGWDAKDHNPRFVVTVPRPNSSAPVVPLEGVAQVAAGGRHSVFLMRNGTVMAVGLNTSGQLGNNGLQWRISTPVQVSGITNAVQVTAGISESFALLEDGTVWGWGRNHHGQLGDGSMITQYTPVQVYGLENIVKISTGVYYSLALDANGDMWIWGRNQGSRLCDGTIGNAAVPVLILFEELPEECDCSDYCDCGYDCNCGEECYCPYADEDCYDEDCYDEDCYDEDCYEEGYYDEDVMTADEIVLPTGPRIVYIEAGAYHSLAIDEDGNVWAWGSNSRGQLGTGGRSWTRTRVPAQVQGLAGRDIISVTAGREFTIALDTNGTVWSWGSNDVGVLGNHALNHSATPARVMAGAAALAAGQSSATLNLLPDPILRPLNPRIEYPEDAVVTPPLDDDASDAAQFYPSVLYWDFGPGARGYRIYVNGETLMEAPETVAGRPFDLLSLGLEAGVHSIQVRRIGHGEIWSHLSDVVLFETNGPIGAPENVRIENVTTLRWDSVANSVGYYVYVDGARATTRINGTVFNLASLDLMTASYRIQVRAALPMRMVSPLSAVVIYDSYAMNLANETENEIPSGSGEPSPITALEIHYDGESLEDFILRLPDGTRQLTAVTTPVNTNDGVEWESNNTNIITVDQDGLVRAVSTGTATIYLRVVRHEDLMIPFDAEEIYAYVHVSVLPALAGGGGGAGGPDDSGTDGGTTGGSGGAGTGTGTGGDDDSDVPRTGDDFEIPWLILTLSGTGAIVAGVLLFRLRGKNDSKDDDDFDPDDPNNWETLLDEDIDSSVTFLGRSADVETENSAVTESVEVENINEIGKFATVPEPAVTLPTEVLLPEIPVIPVVEPEIEVAAEPVLKEEVVLVKADEHPETIKPRPAENRAVSGRHKKGSNKKAVLSGIGLVGLGVAYMVVRNGKNKSN